MKRVDIKLGYVCNNNCFFCIQGEEKRKTYAPKPLEEIKDILYKEYKKGARFVIFTGGEPTLHKTLKPSLVYAKKLGYKVRRVQSNGQNFSDMKYCIELIKAGANAFQPSIHGYKPETHDYLVQTSGAWEKVVKGIRNLKILGQSVVINSVITKQNYKEAPLLAKLLVKLNVNYFQYTFPHIGGNAYKYWKEIVPTKTEIKPYINAGLDIAIKAGIRVKTEAIPYCFLQGYEKVIAEQYNTSEVSVYDAEYEIDNFLEYIVNEGKAKGKQCIECKMNRICEGPWKEYPQLFGWDEFKAIK